MRIVSVQSPAPAEIDAWGELAERASEPNPFFEPSFVLPAAESLDAQPPELLVLDEGGAWTGCIPVGVTRVLGKRMALSTWRHPYCQLGTPLVDRDCVVDFARALVRRLEGWRNSHFMILRSAVDGPVLAAIRDAARHSRAIGVLSELTGERAVAFRHEDPPSHLTKLKPRRRRELLKRRKRLAERLGGELTVVDRSDDPAAVEDFLRLEAGGWKGRAGTAMAVCGNGPWFRSVCEKFAARGRLQLLALEGAGQVVAMQCNISANDSLFNFKVAFDERFKRQAPGIQLELESIRIFQESREERMMDSCAEPDNELVNRLWQDRRPITTLIVGPCGPSAILARSTIRGVRAARARRHSRRRLSPS